MSEYLPLIIIAGLFLGGGMLIELWWRHRK